MAVRQKMTKNTSDFNIAVIGAGASGLSIGYELQKLGFKVDIFEKSDNLGGLAGAVQLSKGRIDSFYHHLFKSDKFILEFIKKNKISSEIVFKRTITGHIWNNKYYDISSILSLKKSNLLSNFGFFRLLLGGAIIKYFPTTKELNNKLVYKIASNLFGKEASSKIWNPLLYFKFGKYAELMPYSWLRARIQDRTIELGYLSNGFESLYNHLADAINNSNGNVYTQTVIKKVEFSKDKKKLKINGKNYDRAVITTSPKINSKLLKDVHYSSRNLKYLGAICGIIEFNKRPIPSYWLGIADTNKRNKSAYKEFLAAISYAELDDEWNKSGKPTWPLYLASYCTKDQYKKYTKEEWKKIMIDASLELNKLSGIEKIEKKNIINFKLSFAEYAQPILSPGQNLFPNPETAKFCYFANMHNIFPNDRGQNRSFYLGEIISEKIYNDLIKKI